MAAIRYPVSKPSLGSRERALLLDAFDSGWVSSRGAYVERVIRDFPPLVGAAAGAPCTSGTDEGRKVTHHALDLGTA